MANRTTFTHLSPPPVAGGGPTGFVAEYAERMKQLFDASAIPLTSVGGTANAVTATLDPVLDGSGLVDGMKFTLTFGGANTAGMTLAINGGSALAILDNQGAALVSNAVASGMRALLEYIGGSFRILSRINATATGGAGPYAITITASTTWARPAGYADDTLVRVQAWGGGGGGATGGGAGAAAGGGGGGGYVDRFLRYADVPTSVVCTIGAGGGAGGTGGNTTFGSLVTAYGGGPGTAIGSAAATCGGGGGGEHGVGGSGNPATGGSVGGGASGEGARTIWGGGGGGSGNTGPNGGNAVHGGGGGGGRFGGGTSGSSGASLFGGNGGTGSGGAGGAGVAPGGGGGAGQGGGGAGARGEIRIQILG